MNKAWGIRVGFEQEGAEGGGDGVSSLWPADGGGLALPIQSPLDAPQGQEGAEGGEGDEGAPQGHQRSPQGHQEQGAQRQAPKTQGKVGKDSEWVPRTRINEIVQSKDATISQLQAVIQGLMGEDPRAARAKKGGASEETEDERKSRQAEFFRDPKGYNDRVAQELRQEFESRLQEANGAIGYELDKRMVRQLHGENSEVEQGMVDVIQNLGLKRLGPQMAVRAAYRIVTGKDLPASLAVQQAQGLKDRMRQPNSGGGEGEPESVDTLGKMPLSEVAKDPQAYVRRMVRAATTQP